jgi:plasmid stabilization system protein ParE
VNVRLLPAVLDDVEKSVRFYGDLQPELGPRFREALNAALRSIQQRPQSFPIIFNHRRALLRSFPYAVYFRTENDDIFVVLIIHLARRPQLAAALLRRRKNDAP